MRIIILLVLLAGCSGYNEVCLNGHVYYEKYSWNRGYMANKLQDDGRPVKCKKTRFREEGYE